MKDHPEADKHSGIEPTVGEQLRLCEFNKRLDSLGRDELLEISKVLAKQSLVTHPSVIRWLAHEAARNLGENSTKDWRKEAETLKHSLSDQSRET